MASQIWYWPTRSGHSLCPRTPNRFPEARRLCSRRNLHRCKARRAPSPGFEHLASANFLRQQSVCRHLIPNAQPTISRRLQRRALAHLQNTDRYSTAGFRLRKPVGGGCTRTTAMWSNAVWALERLCSSSSPLPAQHAAIYVRPSNPNSSLTTWGVHAGLDASYSGREGEGGLSILT